MKQAAAFPVLAAVSSMSFCVAVGCELFLQGGSVMTAENAPGSRKLFLTGKEILSLVLLAELQFTSMLMYTVLASRKG